MASTLDPSATASGAASDPPAVAPCDSAQLRASGASLHGAGGSLAGGFTVHNDGQVPCTVVGRPEITLLDVTGKVLRTVAGPTDQPAEPVVLSPRSEFPPPGEPAAGDAGVFLVWSNWCEAAPAPPLGVRVRWPTGGETIVRLDTFGAPRCDNEQAGSTIAIGPFEATEGPETP